MSEIVAADLPQFPVQSYVEDDKVYGEIITAGLFLPRVQLIGGDNELAKQGKITPGHYALIRSKDQFEVLGPQIEIFPFSMRFKAIRFLPEKVLAYHNPKMKEFTQIRQDSELPNSGCMYGLEFLVWVSATRCFATFYLNSKTSRRQAPAMKGLLQEKRAVTLRAEFIKKGKYSWHGPVVSQCSTPFELPPVDEIINQAERFANPKDSVEEKADPVLATDREV